MKIITIGEMLVEVMRKDIDNPLDSPGEFVGPFPSGAPAIFIDAVAKLGISSGIIGGVGKDEFGDCLFNRLKADRVDLSGVKVDEKLSTGVAFVSYFSDGSRRFLFHMGNSAAGTISSNDVSRDFLKSSDVLHVNGSSLAMGEKMRRACYLGMEMAKEEGVAVSFDPNLRTELLGVEKTREICAPLLDSCDIFIPGEDELKGITGLESEKEATRAMFDRGAELVAVKKGSKGCKIHTKAGSYRGKPFEVEEIDPTGAGDAFSAAAVVGWLEEMEPEELARFTNAVGAAAVTRKGPMEGLRERSDIKEMVNRNGD